MSTDVESFKQIQDSLNLGNSSVGVARSAAEQITSVLQDMKELIVSAQEENVDRTKIQTDIAALRDQVGSIVGAAQFNGLNLIDGASTDDVAVLASLDRTSAGTVNASYINVSRSDLSISNSSTAATYGGTAVTDLSLIDNGGTNAGTADTVATGATQVISIASVADGNGYRIELDDLRPITASVFGRLNMLLAQATAPTLLRLTSKRRFRTSCQQRVRRTTRSLVPIARFRSPTILVPTSTSPASRLRAVQLAFLPAAWVTWQPSTLRLTQATAADVYRNAARPVDRRRCRLRFCSEADRNSKRVCSDHGRLSDDRYRWSDRHRHGSSFGETAGPSGSAAAWYSGAVYREPGATVSAVTVPIIPTAWSASSSAPGSLRSWRIDCRHWLTKRMAKFVTEPLITSLSNMLCFNKSPMD